MTSGELAPQRVPGLVLIGIAAGLAYLLAAFETSRVLRGAQAAELDGRRQAPALASATLEAELAGQYDALLDSLSLRPLSAWADSTLARPEAGAELIPDPLGQAFGAWGPAAWFGIDQRGALGVAGPKPFLLFDEQVEDTEPVMACIGDAISSWASEVTNDAVVRAARLTPPVRTTKHALHDLLHFTVVSEMDADAVAGVREGADVLLDRANVRLLATVAGAFDVRAVDPAGTQWVVLAREVLVSPNEVQRLRQAPLGERADRLAQQLDERLDLLQGAVFQRERLLESLLAGALDELPEDLQVTFGGPPPPVDARQQVPLPEALQHSSAAIWISTDTEALERQLWTTSIALHALLLAVGAAYFWWLTRTLGRVRHQLRRAERIGNFVAAMTHELRTPLSTVALHTEMLLDGWTSDPEVTHEYHQRIANETSRLSRLVERILEQSQLTRGRAQAPSAEPQIDDLSRAIEQLRPSIEAAGPQGDVAFELEDGLSKVRLTDEAIESIATNLVENARKYAPPSEGSEPILVRTYESSKGVLLEVLDRGPGIPTSEQRKIFEAFYRIGNEATRTTTGTGLGLHLVDLQVKGLGGGVDALDREGGGCCIRVTLPRA